MMKLELHRRVTHFVCKTFDKGRILTLESIYIFIPKSLIYKKSDSTTKFQYLFFVFML